MVTRNDIDGETVVTDDLWLVDGPHTREGFFQAIRALQHLIRYANHATLDAAAQVLPNPEDEAIAVRGFGEALAGLPQLCEQLAVRAERFAATPGLSADSTAEHPPEVQAALAAEVLRELASATERLHRLATQAARPLNTLHPVTTD
ncbi:hypothetical protein OG225_07120 [Nocardia sp. NBC_01377]|uniref:hypothetical protein n=1 Tax=Nocardia sp. NBC_01377 TaxID=2903595 RepID=UPI00324FEB44